MNNIFKKLFKRKPEPVPLTADMINSELSLIASEKYQLADCRSLQSAFSAQARRLALLGNKKESKKFQVKADAELKKIMRLSELSEKARRLNRLLVELTGMEPEPEQQPYEYYRPVISKEQEQPVFNPQGYRVPISKKLDLSRGI